MFSYEKKRFLLLGDYQQNQGEGESEGEGEGEGESEGEENEAEGEENKDEGEENTRADGKNIEEEENKIRKVGINFVEYDPSNLLIRSEDIMNTCQPSGFVSPNEKRNKFLKNSDSIDTLKAEFKLHKNSTDLEIENEKFEQLLEPNYQMKERDEESINSYLVFETSVSDFEEESKDETEGDWRNCGAKENQHTLENVCGLKDIKEALFNIIIYPSMYPQFFPKKIHWNHILLYGPPGTGKTMIANALASEINGTFLKITSADLLSHWQGQTEKQIKNLFQKIRSSSGPGILFFDEIDGLFRRRCSDENDNTRRIKTELLIHLDDFTADFENHQTFLIGATNCPWEIDSSFMRRFHKKVFVPLPDKKARVEILKKSFDGIEVNLTSSEWNAIGDETEGYSGSDLVNIVMTSCCERFMEIKKNKYWEVRGDLWIPVNPSAPFSTEMNFEDIQPRKVVVRSIIYTDVIEAVLKTPKTIESEEMLKYYEFLERTKIE